MCMLVFGPSLAKLVFEDLVVAGYNPSKVRHVESLALCCVVLSAGIDVVCHVYTLFNIHVYYFCIYMYTCIQIY